MQNSKKRGFFEILNNFPPDGDIYAFIARTLKHIVPEDTLILVNSFDQETNTLTLYVVEGLGQRQPEVEAILCQPLNGLAFTVPYKVLPSMLTGECNEISGGLKELSFGWLPRETCEKIEALPFFGKIYSAGISWNGKLKGAASCILPPGTDLKNRDLFTFFIRQIAGYISRRESEAALQNNLLELTKKEQNLRESENKFATVFRNSPVALTLLLATDGTFVDVNDAFVRNTGYSHDEVIGVTPDKLGIFTDKNERERLRSSLMNQRGVYGMEMKCRTKTGEIRTCLFSTVFVLMGEKPHILSTIDDITERKRAEIALKESEERYRVLAETSGDVIFIHDLKGAFSYMNQTGLKMIGTTLEDLVGKNSADVFPSTIASEQRRQVSEVIATKQPVSAEMEVPIREGQRWFDIQLMPLMAGDGSVRAVMGSVRDITERKQAEAALQKANRQLNLLSSITRHDILNQLLALKGYLELSVDILHDPVNLAEYIAKEQNIAHTIEDQIQFTKDYQNLGVVAPTWQNVHESMEKAKESLPLRSIAVETDSPTIEVYGDPLLGRVFYNLIDNALMYGGEQMTTIRLSSQESSRGLTIVCEDDGIGIPADKKEAIFNRGYFKHTGFGLYLSREILGITGITITETGESGKGARFEITVPKGGYRFNTNQKK